MLNAVLTFDPSVQPRAVWAKATELGIEFADDAIKTDLMKYDLTKGQDYKTKLSKFYF